MCESQSLGAEMENHRIRVPSAGRNPRPETCYRLNSSGRDFFSSQGLLRCKVVFEKFEEKLVMHKRTNRRRKGNDAQEMLVEAAAFYSWCTPFFPPEAEPAAVAPLSL